MSAGSMNCVELVYISVCTHIQGDYAIYPLLYFPYFISCGDHSVSALDFFTSAIEEGGLDGSVTLVAPLVATGFPFYPKSSSGSHSFFCFSVFGLTQLWSLVGSSRKTITGISTRSSGEEVSLKNKTG